MYQTSLRQSTEMRPRAGQRGVALLLVLLAVGAAFILSLSFLAAQATSTGVSENIRKHNLARVLAESVLQVSIKKIRATSDWRTSLAIWNGQTSYTQDSHSTYTIKLEDGSYVNGVLTGDGQLANNATDNATLTVVANYDGVTHQVRALLTPVNVAQAGLRAEYYSSPTEITTLSALDFTQEPDYTTTIANVNFPVKDSSTLAYPGAPTQYWGVRCSGQITIPAAGTWTFYTTSDDGSMLWIDNQLVVSNDGLHAMQTASGSITLSAGVHTFEARMFQWIGQWGMQVYWKGPGVPNQTIVPARAFTLLPQPAPGAPGIAVTSTFYVWGSNANNGCYIDSFDSSVGPYSGSNHLLNSASVSTNSTGFQQVALSGKAKIYGNVSVGVGGDPARVIATWDKSSITGSKQNLAQNITIPTLTAPTGMPGSEGDKQYYGSTTFSTNRHFHDLQLWGNSTVITVTGNITILVDDDLQIGDKVVINLSAGSSLKLYVSGDASFYSNSQVNLNTGDPTKFQLLMLGSGKISLCDTSKVYAQAISPNGGMYLYGNGGHNDGDYGGYYGGYSNGGSEFFGTFTGRNIEIDDKAKFHIDVRQTLTNNTPTAPTTITATWQE